MFRTIVKNYGVRSGLAAAAVALIVGVIVFAAGSHHVAFADCLDKVAAARSVRYTMSMPAIGPAPAQEMEYTIQYAPAFKMRLTAAGGAVSITDVEQEKVLNIVPQQKKAILMKVPGIKAEVAKQRGQSDFLGRFRQLRDAPQEQLGRKEIDGKEVSGIRVTKEGGEWTIWIDKETDLPVRIELKSEAMGLSGPMVMSRFVFNEDLDDSLFSLTPPEGYSVEEKTLQIDMSPPKQEDLVRTLRLVTTAIMDGVFPQEFNVSTIFKMVAENEKNGKKPDFGVMKEEEAGMALMRGFQFVLMLKPENDWRYVGGGVKVGEAEKPVCWWKPDGAKNYRVVYGDLTVRDVDPKDLPAIPAK